MIKKYKISPLSYFTFENGEMELTNAESKKGIYIDKDFIELLLYLKKYKTYKEIKEFNSRILKLETENLESIINYLLINKFIIKDDNDIEENYYKWKESGWENSFIYHSYTYDYPVLDYSTQESYVRDQSTMKEFLNVEIEPSIYKEIEGPEFTLPIARKYSGVNLNQIIKFNNNLEEVLNLQDLSDILFYTYGQISSLKFPVTQKLLRRTSPSGGARHPSECYVAVLNNDILPKGVYHYSVKNHSLKLIKSGDFESFLNQNCYGLDHFDKKVNTVFFHTSVFTRNWFRYREPKTYKVIYYDFGHILFNFKLITHALSLPTYTIGSGLNDDNIEKLLGIDGYTEGIIYFTAI